MWYPSYPNFAIQQIYNEMLKERFIWTGRKSLSLPWEQFCNHNFMIKITKNPINDIKFDLGKRWLIHAGIGNIFVK